MKNERSVCSLTATFSTGAQKLGQPVPESNFVCEENSGAPVVIKPPVAAGNGTGFLVVDDLVDTGATARVVRTLLPRAHFAAVYAKPAGRAMVDSFITEVSQDTWILFPWDTEPQFVPPLARRGG